jgi:hypothetical protein
VRRAEHNISVAVEVVEAGGPLASEGMVSGAVAVTLPVVMFKAANSVVVPWRT